MADVVGVIFRSGAKTYYFDPAGLELLRGDRVVVQTTKGAEIGQVVDPPHSVDDAEIPAPLKKVTRVATGKDLEAQAASESARSEAMAVCRELVANHGLDMKLVDADIGFGGEKVTFSFYSDDRVDFRGLVADLAKSLKMRVELRQVGAREEARMVGGLGPCGRNLCCTLFPGDEDPVSIRMAKEQNLPLNPMKISGLCGRLMCCLKYEQDQYVRFRKEAPAKGTAVSTPAGEGVVVGYNVPKDAITVRFEDGSYTDIRLSGCQCREGGGLTVIPVVEEPPFPAALEEEDTSELEALAMAEQAPEALAVVEAEVITGTNGEPVEVIVAESARRGRSRRGRGRRGKGGGQTQGGNAAPGAVGPSVATGESGRGRETSGEIKGRGQHRGQRPPHGPGEHPGQKQHGEQGSSGDVEEMEQPGAGGGRPRRRRRRRLGNGGAAGGSTSGGGGEG